MKYFLVTKNTKKILAEFKDHETALVARRKYFMPTRVLSEAYLNREDVKALKKSADKRKGSCSCGCGTCDEAQAQVPQLDDDSLREIIQDELKGYSVDKLKQWADQQQQIALNRRNEVVQYTRAKQTIYDEFFSLFKNSAIQADNVDETFKDRLRGYKFKGEPIFPEDLLDQIRPYSQIEKIQQAANKQGKNALPKLIDQPLLDYFGIDLED